MSKIKESFESRYYSMTMLVFAFFYSGLFLISDDIAKIFQLLLILGSLPIFIFHRKIVFKDPMIKILFAIIIAQILSWIYAATYLPDIAYSVPKIDRLAKLFSFFFIAYWLKGKVGAVCILWMGLVTSFIIGCMIHPNFLTEVSTGITGTRVNFGMKNAQFTTMLAGSALLLTSYITYLCFNKLPPFLSLNKKYRAYLLSICLFIIIWLVFIALISQSRQVWLALTLTSLLVPIFYAFTNDNISKRKIIFSYLTLCIFALGISQLDAFHFLFLRGKTSMQILLSGNIKDLPMDSVGIRIDSWIEAFNWIKQSPIIGNDNSAIGEVIRQSTTFPAELRQRFGHLHSYHIEVLVAYGFLGLGLVYSIYFWLIRSLFIYRKHHPEITPFLWFSLAFVTYWFIVNGFETFNSRSMGVYVHNIMLAGFYTFYLTHSLNKQEN